MKSITAATIIGLAALAMTSAQEPTALPAKDLKEPIALSWFFNDIPGTTLCTNETRSHQKLSGWSQHTCLIGYRRTGSKGTQIFTTVLKLPPLDNDRYIVTYGEGSIAITTKKQKVEVATLDLDALAPGCITRSHAKEEAADH